MGQIYFPRILHSSPERRHDQFRLVFEYFHGNPPLASPLRMRLGYHIRSSGTL